MDITEDEIIGVTTAKAAKIAGVTPRHLAAWELAGLVRPSVSEKVGNRTVRVYGLDDLVELLIVTQLRQAGAAVDAIRHVVEGNLDQTPRPLSEMRWGVEDGRIYVSADGETWFDGRRVRQTVGRPIIFNLRELRASAREAALARDPEQVGRIERRKGVKRGRPVFAGTRLPVEVLREYFARGYSDARIMQSFPILEPPDIATARRELIGA